jgi:hypothetical protein
MPSPSFLWTTAPLLWALKAGARESAPGSVTLSPNGTSENRNQQRQMRLQQ